MKQDQLTTPAATEALAVRSEPTTLQILQKVADSGLTAENVTAFRELVQLKREEDQHQNKIAFNRAFFALKKDVATLDLYCDKAAHDKSGNVMYRYCSESEIMDGLDPLLMKHGFTMLFGQTAANDRLVAEITLIHEEGHEEKRSYAVRQGSTNAAKDATQADTGATTSAWRHLVTKMFGLKSRISDGQRDDLSKEGEIISPECVQYLKEQVKDTGSDEAKFLATAGVTKFEEIRVGSYDVLVRMLTAKARRA